MYVLIAILIADFHSFDLLAGKIDCLRNNGGGRFQNLKKSEQICFIPGQIWDLFRTKVPKFVRSILNKQIYVPEQFVHVDA
jgi:hypothetical protein